jgi:hypothetical protein
MLLHAHVTAVCQLLAHSVFLGALQQTLMKAVKDLKKSCTGCVYVWNKYVRGNHTFCIRNQSLQNVYEQIMYRIMHSNRHRSVKYV